MVSREYVVVSKMSALGQNVIVENRPGAGGSIGVEAAARQAPDGYTMVYGTQGTQGANLALYKKVGYDPVADFAPVHGISESPLVLVINPNRPFKSVPELIAYAKANPGKLNYGSWSVGNPVHLGSELFESATGTQMEHVIFKETTQLYTSVSTGEIDFALGSAATAGPLYRAGKLRLLAFAGPQRSAEFPDVPTVAESGGPKDFAVTGWNAIAVPPGLPAAVADKIRKDIEQALTGPEVAEKFKTFGYEQFPTTRAQFNQFVKDESQRFGDVIRKANVSLD